MKKNLILMMLLLTGAVSMNAQELLYDGPKVVVAGNVVNSGKITSNIPIELRGENAKIDNLEGTESKITAAGMIVGEGTLVDNKGTLIVGEAPRELVIGSNHYSIGDFGEAGVWMTENLRETTGLTRRNKNAGDYTSKSYAYPTAATIDSLTSTLTDHPEYGLFYTWAAATNGENLSIEDQGQTSHSQIQGICPNGWHLPSDLEWTQLEKVINSSTNEYSDNLAAGSDWTVSTGRQGTNQGQKMKSKTAVNDQATNGASYSGVDGGFDAYMVGFVKTNGNVDSYGLLTYFWSSSSNSGTLAWFRDFNAGNKDVGRDLANRAALVSVRCKRD